MQYYGNVSDPHFFFGTVSRSIIAIRNAKRITTSNRRRPRPRLRLYRGPDSLTLFEVVGDTDMLLPVPPESAKGKGVNELSLSD
jgi:hypothetical protein